MRATGVADDANDANDAVDAAAAAVASPSISDQSNELGDVGIGVHCRCCENASGSVGCMHTVSTVDE